MSSLSCFGKRNIGGHDKGKNDEIFKAEKISAYGAQEKWIDINPKNKIICLFHLFLF